MLEVYDTVDLWKLTSHVITIIKLLIPILWKDELSKTNIYLFLPIINTKTGQWHIPMYMTVLAWDKHMLCY